MTSRARRRVGIRAMRRVRAASGNRPHIARGPCEPCYRKARAAERRHGGEAATTADHRGLKSSRLHQHAACSACDKTTRPHHSDGLCVDCYRERCGLGDYGHEDLAISRAPHRPPTSITSRQGRALLASTSGQVASATMDVATPAALQKQLSGGHRPTLRPGHPNSPVIDEGASALGSDVRESGRVNYPRLKAGACPWRFRQGAGIRDIEAD